MRASQAHAKAIRLHSLRYGGTNQSAKRPLRSSWYERKRQLLESVGVVLLLALFVGVEMGLAI